MIDDEVDVGCWRAGGVCVTSVSAVRGDGLGSFYDFDVETSAEGLEMRDYETSIWRWGAILW